jgi:hypothetical protein
MGRLPLHTQRWVLQHLIAAPQDQSPARLGLPLVVLWIAVMVVLQLVRQPGVPAWDSIWAEDGGVFLSDALARPLSSTLGDPHAGYLHLAPRLINGLAAALPLEHAALVLSVVSALVVSFLSVYVYFASASLLRSQWARVMLAGLVVLMPATAYETNANTINLHFYLIFACFWAFLARPRSWLATAAGAAVALAAALSDPLAGLLMPLALLQGITSQTWRSRIIPLVFVVGLAAQLVLAVTREAPKPFSEASIAALPGIYALRVAGSLFVGDRFLDELWELGGWAFAYGSLVLVLLMATYGMVKADLRRRFYLTTCLVYSMAFLAVPLMLRGTEDFILQQGFSLNGSRYTVVPILFLVVLVLLVLDEPGLGLPEATWRKAQYAFVLLTVALVVVNYPNPAVRTAGPSWRTALAVAQRDCAGEGEERWGETDKARIPVAPNIQPPVWVVQVKCERIR